MLPGRGASGPVVHTGHSRVTLFLALFFWTVPVVKVGEAKVAACRKAGKHLAKCVRGTGPPRCHAPETELSGVDSSVLEDRCRFSRSISKGSETL